MELTIDIMNTLLGTKYETRLPAQLPANTAVDSLEPAGSGDAYLINGDPALVLHIVSADSPAARDAVRGSSWTVICPPGRLQDARRDAATLPMSYYRYVNAMTESSGIRPDLGRLLDEAHGFLGADLAVYDSEFNELGRSMSAEADAVYPFRAGERPDPEELYIHDPAFDATFSSRGLTLYERGSWITGGARPFFYHNVYYRERYIARVCMMPLPDLTGGAAQQLMADAAAYLETCIRALYAGSRQRDTMAGLGGIWRDLLRGRPVDRREAERLLSVSGWSVHDSLRAGAAIPMGYAVSEQSMTLVAAHLEAEFPESLTEIVDGRLCILINETRSDPASLRQRFSSFLRDNLLCAGLSNTFDDFFEGKRYMLQADEALSLGRSLAPQQWRYDYEDLLYAHIIRASRGEYRLEDLCPPKLRILMDYDSKTSGSGLTDTLLEYVRCRFSAAETARNMYIHRTTFFYRMERIHALTGIDLTDWDELLPLAVYAAALKEDTEKGRRD